MLRSNVPPAGLPDDWAPQQLLQICTIHGGGRLGLNKSDYVATGAQAYSAAGPDGFVEKVEGTAPSIILSSIGARCGKSFLTQGAWTTLANTQVITPKADAADARYLHSILNDENYWNRSGSAQPFIKPSDVKGAWVPLPPLDEQRRIADVLRSADDAVSSEKFVIRQLHVSYAETLNAFLSRGNAMKDGALVTGWATGSIKGIERLPPNWQIARLTDIARLESGHTPSRQVATYWEGGDIGWISLHDTKNLEQREIRDTSLKITAAGLANSSARVLPTGTVCLSRTATVGKCVMMGVPMATSQDFANFVCSDRLESRYLLHLFRWMAPIWNQLSSGSTHKTIYMPTFKSLQIILPDLNAQKEIADTLDSISFLIEACSEGLELKQSLRAKTASDLLSGRVRVPA